MSEIKFLKTLSEQECSKISKSDSLGKDLRKALDIPMNKPMCIGDTSVRVGKQSKKNDVFVVEREKGNHFYVVIEPMDDELAYCYSIYPR